MVSSRCLRPKRPGATRGSMAIALDSALASAEGETKCPASAEVQQRQRHTAVSVWLQTCARNGMDALISHSRRHSWSVLLLTMCIAPTTLPAADSMAMAGYSRGLAFARYVALQEQRDPFVRAQSSGVVVEASLPDLYKSAGLLAVRKRGANHRSQLQILQLTGDGTVAEEVINRYFTVREQMEGLALSSRAITPTNYKFHFAREVRTSGGVAYVYDITPKKKGLGLVSGQIWMDSETGQEITLTGHINQAPLIRGRIDIVQETTEINGALSARTTHLAFLLPRLGRAELVTTEIVMTTESFDPSDFMSSHE